jgi:hypothetical protein
MRSLLLSVVALTVSTVVAAAQVPAAPTGPARDLPSTVLNAVQKAYPSATITDASQERQDGQIAFRVTCQDKGRQRVLVYDLEGSILEAAEQVDEKDLPKAVSDAVRSQGARATYVKGMKVTRGVIVHYELTLRGTRKTTLIVKPDGAVVSLR